MESWKLVLYSFGASLGFGVVFRIKGKNLLWAGAAGAFTRCFYLLYLSMFQQRIVYVMLSAAMAALFAEVLARVKQVPSTYFLYPAIVPLIPGDLLYNAMAALIRGERDLLVDNIAECALALAGLSFGFVIVSTMSYYYRKYHRLAGKEMHQFANVMGKYWNRR